MNIIRELNEINVKLELNIDGNLKVIAPKGVFTQNEDLYKKLQNSKLEIIDHLRRIQEKSVHQPAECQLNMWIDQQQSQYEKAYEIPILFEVVGEIDLILFKTSLSEIIKKHDALRMSLDTHQGDLTLRIHPAEILNIPFEVRHTTEAQSEQAIKKFFAENINIENAPLFKVGIIKNDKKSFLLLLFHHLIVDGWGVEIFIKDLIEIYKSLKYSKEYVSIKTSYLDYIVWEKEWLKSNEAADQINFWLDQYKGWERPALIQADRVGKSKPKAASQRVHFKQDDIQDIKKISDTLNMSFFHYILGVYFLTLRLYSNADDITVGIPVTNRQNRNFEAMIGIFVNTLAIRYVVDSSETVRQYLLGFKQKLLDCLSYSSLPLSHLSQKIYARAPESEAQLFQTMFVYEQGVVSDFDFEDFSINRQRLHDDSLQRDITVGCSISDNGGYIDVVYDESEFSVDFCQSFLNNFANALRSIPKALDYSISKLNLIDQGEYNRLISLGNLSPSTLQNNFNGDFLDYFYDVLDQFPDNIAIVEGKKTISYAELHSRSDDVAYHLAEFNIKKDSVVAVQLERSLEFIISLLGIIKLGATYLPIDPKYPQARVEWLLYHSKAEVLLHGQNHKFIPNFWGTYINYFDIKKKALNEQTKIRYENNTRNMMYMMYTSGSTGEPKAVKINHKAIANLIDYYINSFNINSIDKFTQFASQSFDTFSCEVWPCLAVGAELHLVDDEVKVSPELLIDFIRSNKITICDLPTSIAEALWHENLNDLSLRILKIGGEKLVSHPRQSLTFEVINTYGVTECTVESMHSRLEGLSTDHSIIGYPISGVGVAIVNSDNALLPFGVVGELVILGTGNSQEYFDNVCLTREKYITLSLQEKIIFQGFKTGDYVRWTSHGMEFLGRKDNLVKIRNHLIELDEIKLKILSLPGVAPFNNCIVTSITTDNYQHKIVVYYVKSNTNDLFDEVALKNELRKQLPDYMVPNHFVELLQIPLTFSGKINYKQLPNPFANTSHTGQDNRFNSDIENKLLQIWQDVLCCEKISLIDNFFELGGDSLSSIKIVAAARTQGIPLTPKDILKYQTIENIIKHFSQNKLTNLELPLMEDNMIPLLPIQKWFLAENMVNPDFYNQSYLLNVPENFDTKMHFSYLKSIAETHGLLRAVLDKKEDKLALKIKSMSVLENIIENVTIDSSKSSFAQEVFILAKRYSENLNLYRGPLFKSIFIRDRSTGMKRLLWISHHMIIDGVSWQILFAQIRSLYLNNGGSNPSSSSYLTWVNKLQDYFSQSKQVYHKEFWSEQIGSNMSTQFDNDILKFEQSCHYRISISKDKTQKIFSLLDSTQFNNFSLISTLILKTIAIITMESQLIVEIESHGREEENFGDIDLSQTLGWFTVAYPLKVNNIIAEDVIGLAKKLTKSIKSVPLNGHSFGWFNYSSHPSDSVPHRVHVTLNYHGLIKNDKQNELFSVANEKLPQNIDPRNHRNSIIYTNFYISEGELILEITTPSVSKWSIDQATFEEILMNELSQSTNIHTEGAHYACA